MHRRTFLAAGAVAALAGCSQEPAPSDPEPKVSAGDPQMKMRNGTKHPVVPLSQTAEEEVFSGVSLDMSYLDGEAVADSHKYLIFAVPPSGLDAWAPSLDESADSARVNDLTVTDSPRQIADDVTVSNLRFDDSESSVEVSRGISATFTNKTGSEIELYPYLVATYEGKQVLAANPGPDAFGVTLGAGEMLQHESSIIHPNVNLVDGLKAYPCVSS